MIPRDRRRVAMATASPRARPAPSEGGRGDAVGSDQWRPRFPTRLGPITVEGGRSLDCPVDWERICFFFFFPPADVGRHRASRRRHLTVSGRRRRTSGRRIRREKSTHPHASVSSAVVFFWPQGVERPQPKQQKKNKQTTKNHRPAMDERSGECGLAKKNGNSSFLSFQILSKCPSHRIVFRQRIQKFSLKKKTFFFGFLYFLFQNRFHHCSINFMIFCKKKARN